MAVLGVLLVGVLIMKPLRFRLMTKGPLQNRLVQSLLECPQGRIPRESEREYLDPLRCWSLVPSHPTCLRGFSPERRSARDICKKVSDASIPEDRSTQMRRGIRSQMRDHYRLAGPYAIISGALAPLVHLLSQGPNQLDYLLLPVLRSRAWITRLFIGTWTSI